MSEGDPAATLPPTWSITSRERMPTGDDAVTYRRAFDHLDVIVSDVPIDGGGFKRMVSASQPDGPVTRSQERAVRSLFLYPDIPIESRDPLMNRGVSWFIQTIMGKGDRQ